MSLNLNGLFLSKTSSTIQITLYIIQMYVTIKSLFHLWHGIKVIMLTILKSNQRMSKKLMSIAFIFYTKISIRSNLVDNLHI